MPSLREQMEDRYGLTATTKNVAEVLKCHPSHVRAMCESGELPAVRIGSRWYVPTHALAAMLDPGCKVYD